MVGFLVLCSEDFEVEWPFIVEVGLCTELCFSDVDVV